MLDTAQTVSAHVAAAIATSSRARISRLGKESFWIVIGQIAAVVGSIVGIRMLTQAMPPAAYGELALGMTVAALAHHTILGPLASAVLRFFSPAVESADLPSYMRTLCRLLSLGSSLVIAAGLAGALLLYIIGATALISLLLATTVFAIILGLSACLNGMQNAMRQRLVVAWHAAIGAWLKFGIAYMLLTIVAPTSCVAMLGYALGTAVVLVSQLVLFNIRLRPLLHTRNGGYANSTNWTSSFLSYSWPLASWGIFVWGQSVSDRWALNAFLDTSSVGHYAVLFQLGYAPIAMLSGLMTQLVTPIFFARAGDGTDATRTALTIRANLALAFCIVGVTLVATGCAFAVHHHVFTLVVAPEYRALSGYWPWLILSGGIFAAGQVTALSPMIATKTMRLMLPKITTAILGIAMNLAGAYVLGIRGVVFAGAAFSTIYFVCSMCVSCKLLSDRPPLVDSPTI